MVHTVVLTSNIADQFLMFQLCSSLKITPHQYKGAKYSLLEVRGRSVLNHVCYLVR